MGVFDIIVRYQAELLHGLQVTLRLCLYIWPAGLVAGVIIGAAGARWPRVAGWPTRAISFVLSGVPILVFLFWLHYPLQYQLNLVIDPFYTAVAALSTVNAFWVADVIRGVLMDFPEQYLQA